MSMLVPRFFGDMSDWFEVEFPRRNNLIKVEDLITENEYCIRAELPGMDPVKDIEVSISHGILTIHAERKEETQTHSRTEFRYGMLQRSVRLPASADEEHVSAKYANGILEIVIPLKVAERAVKQVEITKGE